MGPPRPLLLVSCSDRNWLNIANRLRDITTDTTRSLLTLLLVFSSLLFPPPPTPLVSLLPAPWFDFCATAAMYHLWLLILLYWYPEPFFSLLSPSLLVVAYLLLLTSSSYLNASKSRWHYQNPALRAVDQPLLNRTFLCAFLTFPIWFRQTSHELVPQLTSSQTSTIEPPGCHHNSILTGTELSSGNNSQDPPIFHNFYFDFALGVGRFRHWVAVLPLGFSL